VLHEAVEQCAVSPTHIDGIIKGSRIQAANDCVRDAECAGLHRGAEDLGFIGMLGVVVEYGDAEPFRVLRRGRRQGVGKCGLQQELAWRAEQHGEMTKRTRRIAIQDP
jgi:hypothetical protein